MIKLIISIVRVGVVKAASYAASWTMSKASTEIYWKLYHVSPNIEISGGLSNYISMSGCERRVYGR